MPNRVAAASYQADRHSAAAEMSANSRALLSRLADWVRSKRRSTARSIVREPKRESAAPYRVTVERRGVAPLETRLVVRAASRRAAGELASSIAERKRGGMFEPTNVRSAPKDKVADYDDSDL